MQEFSGTLADFTAFVAQEQAVLCYFSTDECQVCKSLKPRISELVSSCFEKIKLIYIPLNKNQEIAGQFRIFAAPTLVIFFEGREFLRKSRSLGIEELKNEITRPYQLMFS